MSPFVWIDQIRDARISRPYQLLLTYTTNVFVSLVVHECEEDTVHLASGGEITDRYLEGVDGRLRNEGHRI